MLFGLGLTVILIEVRNHTHMWHEHQSGQTIWTDPELLWEIVLFGLVLPLLAGVLLEYSGRTAIERDKMVKAQALRRALIEQMHEAESWPELTKLIVTTPGNVVSADRTWLLAQRADDESFAQIAQWQRPTTGSLPLQPAVTPSVCEQCAATKAVQGTRIFSCTHLDAAHGAAYTRYCRWLSSEETGKTALLIDVPADRPLTTGQIKVLDDLGDEMSLAIINANLHYEKQRQIDSVMNERQRIARDLHDTLGQNISYLRFKLEQLSDSWSEYNGVELQGDLANMMRAADEAYEQVRDTLEELRTAEHRNLSEAVQQYAAQAGKRSGFSVQVHTDGQPEPLSARKVRQIMYVLREALNNVEKHAHAHSVDIDLLWRDGAFTMKVRDDGVGFRPRTVNRADRYGLSIMAERARTINAELSIDSTPEEGSEVSLRMPLSGSATAVSKKQ